jgi:TPR repeat protein
MADVAHDASGPASPKPGDVALQQASRANSPDTGKLRVFISYSRDDADFADQLDAALDAYGFESSMDRHGVSGGEEWKRRLGNLISEADTVVFVLTPTSARSPICSWEVEEAARLGKRILPANWRPLEDASPPPQLRERNYIFFYDNPKEPGSGFGTGLAKLVAALNTDFEWLREHTRYLQRATEWDRGGRPANRLLSGDDIAEARAWATHRPKNAPEPTALHLDFIRASEAEAEARSSAQRKQLEAMTAAQADRATALKKAEDALRKRARIRNIAFVVVSLFALLAGLFGWYAEEQRTATGELLSRAGRIIGKLRDQMDINTEKEAFAVFQTGADQGDPPSMARLADFYAKGLGVPKDYAKAREWFQKAADKGNTAAMVGLGELYAEGEGVPQDYAKAREWLKKAADKDYAPAMAWLGNVYVYGVPKDYAKAREWFEKGADKGSATAMIGLGRLFANGSGVPKDYAKAREWFQKGADKGDATATDELEKLAIHETVEAGRYPEALQMQEALASKVEAVETKREGKPGEETAWALRNVAWYAVFAREFVKALTVSDRAHALLPDDLTIEPKRAHALMFLEGREEDAKALYLAHKGEVISLGEDAWPWESAIAAEFAELRKAGLMHPMMADIEKELGVSR